ncbi:hypothetical protein Dimus_037523, partial [Dionaea muscipula]
LTENISIMWILKIVVLTLWKQATTTTYSWRKMKAERDGGGKRPGYERALGWLRACTMEERACDGVEPEAQANGERAGDHASVGDDGSRACRSAGAKRVDQPEPSVSIGRSQRALLAGGA